MEAADRAYVIATWLRSYQATARGLSEFRGHPEAFYLHTYNDRIKAALEHGTRVAVGFDSAFPRVIAGWMAFTTGTLHFVYVRAELRRQGVARALLSTAQDLWAHSHRTPAFARLLVAGVVKTVHRPQHFAGEPMQPQAAE